MKKHFYYAMAFLLFLTVSCVSEKIETQDDRASYNPEMVWEYNGEDTVLEKIIQELKKGSNRESLERKLLKNEVLWKNAEYLVIEDKKRILVPFLSVDKENVIGFLTLYRDAENKIQYDMTVRRDVYTKNIKLPFWTPSIWAGYFMAYDRTILGKKNGNPGVMRKAIPKGKLNTINARTITTCFTYTTETCITLGEVSGQMGESNISYGVTPSTYCTNNYHSVCIDTEVQDPVPITPAEDPNDNSGSGSEGTVDAPAPIPPSCESFNFVAKPGTIWQESAVKNIHFNIVVIDQNGYHISQIIEYPNAILFGAPTNLQIGNTTISSGIAATLSAKALQESMAETVHMYGNKPVSEMTVRLYFEERLKHNYPLFIPGGRVNFNASSYTGIPTNYETNAFGTGNCN